MPTRIRTIAGLLLAVGLACGQKMTPLAEGPYQMAQVGGYRLLLATTPKQMAHGLMYVPVIPKDRGMAFVLPNGGARATFWMKDCVVPMDMVFIGTDGAVQGVQTAQVVPKGTPDIHLTIYTTAGPVPASQLKNHFGQLPLTAFVIEVAAGDGWRFARAWSPDLAVQLTHPAPAQVSSTF